MFILCVRVKINKRSFEPFCVWIYFFKSIDDLRKSRGLHSVNAYRHGLYMLAGVAQSRHAFVGGTVSTGEDDGYP